MVDIIIPVYNALDTLELAVTSALMQGDVRILLVDDGSTDGTARLCDELAHHPRIAVIHQQNRGVSAARNAGLQAAASEWLTFLDADDVLLPDAIGNLLALAGDSQAIQGLVTRSEAPDVPECTVQTLSSRDMLDLALRNPTVHLHTHGWLLRREICNERFNESLRLGEDGEWMMRVLRGAKTVSLAQLNTYCYHLRADSAVHSAADVVLEYLRTLTAAQPTLNYLDMPDAAAQYRLMHLLLMLKHRLRAKPKMLASLSIQKTAIMTMKITVTMIPALMIPVQILLTLILQALILQAILLTILLMTTAQLIIQRIM